MVTINRLLDRLAPPCPPPAGGFEDELPEAFGALDENGEVTVIGYRGEWFVPVKPTLRVRLRNWLVRLVDCAMAPSQAALDEVAELAVVDPPTQTEMERHVDQIARDALLQVMNSDGVLGILMARQSVPENVLESLTSADVIDLYTDYIAPAIDRIEDDLLSQHEIGR
ncbi:hypothetical protein PBI_MEGABEAR_58 [Mycobacterium phage Megabear]|nr:hypothetical protein PBI_MEGABEAR_58 [Mycobacterium phage Megabear]